MSEMHQVLREVFGFETFLSGQEEVIKAILDREDVLTILPTGGGKSLCFQLPSIFMEGIVIVVSPLISLMNDQINSCKKIGFNAVTINSTMSFEMQKRTLHRIYNGEYKFIYVAPERLISNKFRELCANVPISYIVVDEAHCISEWGRDFRPAYMEIYEFIKLLPTRPPVAAFTATATNQVQQEIIAALKMKEPKIVVIDVDRPNLFYGVYSFNTDKEKYDKMVRAIQGNLEINPDVSGIVYCVSKMNAEAITHILREECINSEFYHADMTSEDRNLVHLRFMCNEINVICATIAFGMGIDKSDIRFVYHDGVPPSLERYVQETGRAGRDGFPAECLIFYTQEEFYRNNWFRKQEVYKSYDKTPEEIQHLKETFTRNRKLLSEMYDYIFTDSCFHTKIIRHFDQTFLNVNCKNCENCREYKNFRLTEEDITVEAKKIVSCVYQITNDNYRVFLRVLIDVVRGRKSFYIMFKRLHKSEFFGALRDYDAAHIKKVISVLHKKKFLEIRFLEKRPVIYDIYDINLKVFVIGPRGEEVEQDGFKLFAYLR